MQIDTISIVEGMGALREKARGFPKARIHSHWVPPSLEGEVSGCQVLYRIGAEAPGFLNCGQMASSGPHCLG